MSTAWVIVIACLWLLVIGVVVVVASTLRRVATALDLLAPPQTSSARRAGPAEGKPLPKLEVSDAAGRAVKLADIPGPFVLAVLTSQCAPCRVIADWVRDHPNRLREAGNLVVLTDSDGPAMITLDEALGSVMVADGHSSAFHALQIPGTPFAVAVDANGAVSTSSLLSGPDQLLEMLDASRRARTMELQIHTMS